MSKQHGTHDVEVTNNTRTIPWNNRDKRKLYLPIILLINFMAEENLFVCVECFTVKHAASRFSVRTNVPKKRKEKNESDTWID